MPLVSAMGECAPVKDAEIVATIASRSAGPGTRQNIDEFTDSTARGLEEPGRLLYPPTSPRTTKFARTTSRHPAPPLRHPGLDPGSRPRTTGPPGPDPRRLPYAAVPRPTLAMRFGFRQAVNLLAPSRA